MSDATATKERKPRFTGDIGLSFDAAQQDTVDITQSRPGAGRPKEDLTQYVKILQANYKANAKNRQSGAKTRVAWVNQCATEAFGAVKSKFSTAGREHGIGCTWKVLSENNGVTKFALVASDRVTGRGRKPKATDQNGTNS